MSHLEACTPRVSIKFYPWSAFCVTYAWDLAFSRLSRMLLHLLRPNLPNDSSIPLMLLILLKFLLPRHDASNSKQPKISIRLPFTLLIKETAFKSVLFWHWFIMLSYHCEIISPWFLHVGSGTIFFKVLGGFHVWRSLVMVNLICHAIYMLAGWALG